MNNSICKMVYKTGTSEIIEKKSRFIANVYNIENEDEVSSYINAVHKQYWNARHHCYAFVLGDNNQIQRCSDDGEPSGTAGKPILDVILGNKIQNCLIIVTRYFGGTLLGTGGLVRAYGQAAKEGIQNSIIIEKRFGNKLKIITDYKGLGKIQYIATQMALDILDIEYTDIVSITIVMLIELINEFENKVIEATSGESFIQNQGEQWYFYYNEKVILL